MLLSCIPNDVHICICTYICTYTFVHMYLYVYVYMYISTETYHPRREADVKITSRQIPTSVHIVRIWLIFSRTTCCLGFCPEKKYTFNGLRYAIFSWKRKIQRENLDRLIMIIWLWSFPHPENSLGTISTWVGEGGGSPRQPLRYTHTS